MTERVTLKPGDYVSTAGMTEDQYHAVARAFMAAGADGAVVCDGNCRRAVLGNIKYIEWDCRDNRIFHTNHSHDRCGRHLTPAQVIGATNASGKAQDTLTGALKYACDELDTARQHEAKAAEHRANHDGAMEHVRDMLPDGWMLVRGGVDWAKIEDMADPANWRAGDVVICADGDHADGVSEGKCYVVSGHDEDGWPEIIDDDGDKVGMKPSRFRFHHRPT